MANHPRLEEYDLSSLRYIMWGATPVTESVARIVTERTGVRWLPAYGASELPVITANPVDRPESWRLDSAGLPPAGVELRIADLESGKVLGPGGGRGDPGAQSRPSWPATSPTRPRPMPSPTAGTARGTSGGSSPRGGCT